MLLVLLVLLVLQILQMLLISFTSCRCIYAELINMCLSLGLSYAAADPVSRKKSKNCVIRSDLRHLKHFFENLFLKIVFLDDIAGKCCITSRCFLFLHSYKSIIKFWQLIRVLLQVLNHFVNPYLVFRFVCCV